MTMIIEERLLFKLLQWAGVGQSSQEPNENKDHEISDLISYRTVVPAGPRTDALQIYFERFSIASTELRVGVYTTSQLPDDLRAIKQQLGFPLVKFESPVKLRGFYQSHMLGDAGIYADSLMKHYKKVKGCMHWRRPSLSRIRSVEAQFCFMHACMLAWWAVHTDLYNVPDG